MWGGRLLPALLVSMALHGALWALPDRPEPPPAQVAVDLEVRQLDPAPAGAALPPPRPGPAPDRAHRPLTRRAAPEAPAPALAGETTAEVPAVPVAAEASGTVALAAAGASAGEPAPAGGEAAGAGGPGGMGRDADLLAAYVRRLNEAVHRRFAYPRRAQRARLEGRVVVRVLLDAAGSLRGAAVATSSGHDVLDAAALETVRGVAFPAPPPELGWVERAVDIPLDYDLAQ